MSRRRVRLHFCCRERCGCRSRRTAAHPAVDGSPKFAMLTAQFPQRGFPSARLRIFHRFRRVRQSSRGRDFCTARFKRNSAWRRTKLDARRRYFDGGAAAPASEALRARIRALARVGHPLDLGAFGVVSQPRLRHGRTRSAARHPLRAGAVLRLDPRGSPRSCYRAGMRRRSRRDASADESARANRSSAPG